MSKIDYDLTRIKGIAFDVDGVLSPSTCQLNESGHPIRMGNVKDGFAMQYAVKVGLKIAIITGGFSMEIAHRMKVIGIEDVWQNASEKLPVLEKWMGEKGLSSGEIIYVGDDIPDMKCLQRAGVSCCPADAATEVIEECDYISKVMGGYGVARDIIEQVLRAQGKWDAYNEGIQKW